MAPIDFTIAKYTGIYIHRQKICFCAEVSRLRIDRVEKFLDDFHLAELVLWRR